MIAFFITRVHSGYKLTKFINNVMLINIKLIIIRANKIH